jgi:hypothetical protein
MNHLGGCVLSLKKNLVKLGLRVPAACNIVRDSIVSPGPVVTVASYLDMQ